jgi:dihydropteroate synthase
MERPVLRPFSFEATLKQRIGRFELASGPLVMGVVNVTPDSFSDGGRFFDKDAAVSHALRLIEEGADIVDIGGESSRPGALPATEEEELDRILPVLEGLKGIEKPISIDTRRTRVMREALKAGASMINDIDALTAPGALEAVAASDCAVCLMHKKGEPATMQQAPRYDDVVGEVGAFLKARIEACEEAGIGRQRLVIDPGFGFGKTLEHNLTLLKNLGRFSTFGLPILVGWSRKSSLGKITGRPGGERLPASLAMALLSLQGGATILRVHDVKETKDVIEVWKATQG